MQISFVPIFFFNFFLPMDSYKKRKFHTFQAPQRCEPPDKNARVIDSSIYYFLTSLGKKNNQADRVENPTERGRIITKAFHQHRIRSLLAEGPCEGFPSTDLKAQIVLAALV